jgi:hypothetical protein
MGTSKIGINIDRSAKQIVDRRSQIWKEFDRALSNISDLNRYASLYGNANVAETLVPLTSQNTPPSEIAATLVKLDEQQAIITRSKAEIEADLAKIAATKSQFIKAMIIAVVVLAIVIFFVVKSFK